LSRLVRITLVIALLTALAAAFGGWAGVRIGVHQAGERAGLDEIVHDRLHLTRVQQTRIGAMEAVFATRRDALEAEMRAANLDLAAAIDAEHVYGPRARQAVTRFHEAMGRLQEETIRHVMAMRAVLTPEQARRFDGLIDKALEPPPA
jgi:Spy/CpxP family protein refolding chaperone